MIYVVCEISGGHLVEAFTNEQDAWSHLNWDEAMGCLPRGHYTVREVRLRSI